MSTGGAIDIIKRNGRRPTESYERKKLYDSIVAACLSVQTAHGHAETIARKVTDEVEKWLETRPEVTSHDIRRITVSHLKNHHPDAAYLYEQHRLTL